MYSGTAMTAAIAVSLMAMERIEPKAGSMRITAWGSTICMTVCVRDRPIASAARVWPGRTEAMPARTISAT